MADVSKDIDRLGRKTVMGAKKYLLLDDSDNIIGVYTAGAAAGPPNSLEVGKDVLLTDLEVSDVEMTKKWNRAGQVLIELTEAEKNEKSGRVRPTLPVLGS
jgi:hypothetical protein